MDTMQKEFYRKGYVAGYRDGLKAAEKGKVPQYNNPTTVLPIQAMNVSSRAKNCLLHAGCLYVADVILLDEQRIATMRNLGLKTAMEIGCWLEENHIYHTAWSRYV